MIIHTGTMAPNTKNKNIKTSNHRGNKSLFPDICGRSLFSFTSLMLSADVGVRFENTNIIKRSYINIDLYRCFILVI